MPYTLLMCVWIVVQILVESVPVSSSGHIALLMRHISQLAVVQYGLNMPVVSSQLVCFVGHFEYLLHLPTLCVVTFFLLREHAMLLRSCVQNFFCDFAQSFCWFIVVPRAGWHHSLLLIAVRILLFVTIADTITVLFFLMQQQVGSLQLSVGIGFICTAFVLFSLRYVNFYGLSMQRKDMACGCAVQNNRHSCQADSCTAKECQQDAHGTSCSCASIFKNHPAHAESKWGMPWYQQACFVGIAQGCALMLPGLSRLATVYATARWVGMRPERAFTISWLVQLPLIAAAVLRSTVWFYLHGYLPYLMRLDLLCVVLLASIAAYYALTLVARAAYAQKLWLLAYYMIVPILLWFYPFSNGVK